MSYAYLVACCSPEIDVTTNAKISKVAKIDVCAFKNFIFIFISLKLNFIIFLAFPC